MKIQPAYLDRSGAESPRVATLMPWLKNISDLQTMTIGSDSWEQNKIARAIDGSRIVIRRIP
jgi:hypothetical protein